MGFLEAFVLGFVLLLAAVNPCTAASQNQLNLLSTNNETVSHGVSRSLQQPRSPQTTTGYQSTNRTEPAQSYSAKVATAVSHRLKVYQLARSKLEPTQTLQSQQESEAAWLTSEQLEPGDLDQAQELLVVLPIQGPDLNPPVKQQSNTLVKFEEQRVPVPADSVAVRCGEEEVTVEVKRNFLGNGQWIRSSDLTLGGCSALDTTDNILHFKTELHGCGGTLMMTKEALIYSFSLYYSPTPIGSTMVLKTNHAEVLIQCNYQRKHHVSNDGLRPTWSLFASKVLAEQTLHFSLRLMMEDWQSVRPSSVFFLSDVMHIEAAVLIGHHVPMRVYVDRCVATTTPDPASQPQYHIINNHGCLTDGKLTGAKSYFMQRSQQDKLHFQLKAFRFRQYHRHSLYITCHLKATTISVPINSQHKACSFLAEVQRWVASGGDNEVCGCCDTSCSGQRGKRSPMAVAERDWEATASLGPILVEDRVLKEEMTEMSELLLIQEHQVTEAGSYWSIALLCGMGTALAVVLLVFMAAVTCSRQRKSTGHNVCT